MAKLRNKKPGEAKDQGLIESDRPPCAVVRHEKLCLKIDVPTHRLHGYAELKVVAPTRGVVGLHAHGLNIQRVLCDGVPTEYEVLQAFEPDSFNCANFTASVQQLPVSATEAADSSYSEYLSTLEKELAPELLIFVPESRVASQGDHDAIQNVLKADSNGIGANGNIVLDVPKEEPLTQAEERVKLVHVEYWLEKPLSGGHFLENLFHTSNEQHRARCWFPCVDLDFHRCRLIQDCFFSLFSDSMADKGKDKLPVEESSSSTRRHRRETAAADTQFMAFARTARAPQPSMTAEEQEENDLFTAQLMSMMGTFEQLAKNPRMQKLLKTKDYRTGSQAETSQQATSRQRQVTEPVERVPTVVTGPVQHVTEAQDPARNGHRSNEQSTHPTIPMHTSFPGYFGGGSVFQFMIRPSPGFQGYMPSTGNPMYDNIGVQPGFRIVPGSIGMAGTDLGMAGPARPYVRPMDLSGGTCVSPNTDIPLLKPPVYDSLTPKGKAMDYKEGGQAVKFEPFFGTTDRMKALIFLHQFDAAFTGGNLQRLRR
ncbi:hypothetical protein L7F22_046043 [Adiantum nelumboides]|nr:hypothetical protein [Adiantum nelumboides]